MKLKQLESLLAHLQRFSNPKILSLSLVTGDVDVDFEDQKLLSFENFLLLELELEQYPTGPHIASRMLYTAENSFGDVTDKIVADFGCVCGTLGAAASLLGAEHVIGIDIDSEALELASSNAEELEVNIDFLQCDIKSLGLQGEMLGRAKAI